MTENTNSNYRRPRRELFATPAAGAVWAAICALDAASQHDVLRELQDRLGAAALSATEVRVQRAVAALREAAGMVGRSPSVDVFRRLREENPRAGWPPDSSIRRWLGGSWNDCLKRAHLDPVPDGDALVLEMGAGFTAEEATDAVRACAQELGRVPSLTEYLGWTKRPDVRRRHGRRPLGQGPFDRLFGGWLNALAAAGLVDLETGTWAAPRTTLVRAGVYSHSDEQLHAALREVAETLGHSPRVAEYMAERTRVIEASLAAGQPRTLPTYGAIQRRYAVWDDALAAAALEPLGGRATGDRTGKRGPSPRRLPDEVILAAIRRGYAELGDPYTVNAYRAWRLRVLAEDDVARLQHELPDFHTIWKHYGTWADAVKLALAPPEDDGGDEPHAGTPASVR